MKVRVPQLQKGEWKEVDVDPATCQHPLILLFQGAMDHTSHRCMHCDKRLTVTVSAP